MPHSEASQGTAAKSTSRTTKSMLAEANWTIAIDRDFGRSAAAAEAATRTLKATSRPTTMAYGPLTSKSAVSCSRRTEQTSKV